MANSFFAVQYSDGKFVEAIIELSSSNKFFFLQQMAPMHLCRHDSLEQLNITRTTPLPFLLCKQMPGYVRQVLLYVLKFYLRNGQEWKILD